MLKPRRFTWFSRLAPSLLMLLWKYLRREIALTLGSGIFLVPLNCSKLPARLELSVEIALKSMTGKAIFCRTSPSLPSSVANVGDYRSSLADSSVNFTTSRSVSNVYEELSWGCDYLKNLLHLVFAKIRLLGLMGFISSLNSLGGFTSDMGIYRDSFETETGGSSSFFRRIVMSSSTLIAPFGL